MSLKVITLKDDSFTNDCMVLFNLITDRISPDLLIAIETGGGEIVRRLERSVNIKANIIYVEASRIKRKSLFSIIKSNLIKKLPIGLNNILRILEHSARQFIYKIGKSNSGRNISVGKDDYLYLASSDNICIIDDAIDSGNTIKQVVDEVRRVNKNARISTAVIVKTFESPLLNPDIYLYNDTLIRFPWSDDA